MEDGGKNSKPSEETRIKMSEARLGVKQSKEWVDKKIAKAGSDDAKKYGRVKTAEQKQYLRENSPKFWQGKTRDEETRAKISKTKLEKGFTEKQKEANNKKVYKKDIINNTIIIYESTKEASINENVDQSTISRWCLKNNLIKNILWTYDK